MSLFSVTGKKWLFKKFDSADVIKFSEHYSLTETVANAAEMFSGTITDLYIPKAN